MTNANLPIVIVDALDECGGIDGQRSSQRSSLMKTLYAWSYLPARFKLIVTGRGEHDIESLFAGTRHNLIEILSGENVNTHSSNDIRVFLEYHFRQIASQYPMSLLPDWPGNDVINHLKEKSGGLFVWAEVIIKFISRGEPKEQLDYVLRGSGAGDMATLYQWILKMAFPSPSEKVIKGFRAIFGAVILAASPLSPSAIAHLLSLEISLLEHICNKLQSLIDFRDVLRANHQSLVDFLVDSSSCPSMFCIDRKQGHYDLTLACLRIMEKGLRFNICNLESSYLRNSEVQDLSSRVSQHITPHLSYACRSWASHLQETIYDEAILISIQDFMHCRFLFWLEILSLTRRVNHAMAMLRSLTNWMQSCGKDDSIPNDMEKFVATFATVISQSTPHIYVSALPLSPRNSITRQLYIRLYPKTLTVSGGQKIWPALQQVILAHAKLNAATFSPDGRRIASCSQDMSIAIWDAETGELVGAPLRGHNAPITSLAFSPDGMCLASSSGDKTIRVWDVDRGKITGEPLRGHEGGVISIAFFPNGKRIVSGS